MFIDKLRIHLWNEKGFTLVEALVAVAIMGTISVTFLTGLSTASKGVSIAEEQAKAESLAQSQMDWVKNCDYVYDAAEYAAGIIPVDKGYTNYSVKITAEPLHNPDSGIQKITITITHSGKSILKLSDFKVDR